MSSVFTNQGVPSDSNQMKNSYYKKPSDSHLGSQFKIIFSPLRIPNSFLFVEKGTTEDWEWYQIDPKTNLELIETGDNPGSSRFNLIMW